LEGAASCFPAPGAGDPPASGGTDCWPALSGTDSPPAPGGAESWLIAPGTAPGSGEAGDAAPPGFLPSPGFPKRGRPTSLPKEGRPLSLPKKGRPLSLSKIGRPSPNEFLSWRTRSPRPGLWPCLSTAPVFVPPPEMEAPAPLPPYPAGWIPGTAPEGHFAQRPQERLLPITFSAPHTTPMQITNATTAARSPFMRIERRLIAGRRENQSRAARILPTKLSLRSGRSGMVPP
jgi:hypothetical protein